MSFFPDDDFRGDFDEEYEEAWAGWHQPIARGPRHDIICVRCGARGLKWRATDRGWRLFSAERDDHNAKIEHQCGAVTPSDFEVLP